MVLSRRSAKRNAEPKAHTQQFVDMADMPLDVLIEVRALRESITLNVQ